MAQSIQIFEVEHIIGKWAIGDDRSTSNRRIKTENGDKCEIEEQNVSLTAGDVANIRAITDDERRFALGEAVNRVFPGIAPSANTVITTKNGYRYFVVEDLRSIFSDDDDAEPSSGATRLIMAAMDKVETPAPLATSGKPYGKSFCRSCAA